LDASIDIGSSLKLPSKTGVYLLSTEPLLTVYVTEGDGTSVELPDVITGLFMVRRQWFRGYPGRITGVVFL